MSKMSYHLGTRAGVAVFVLVLARQRVLRGLSAVADAGVDVAAALGAFETWIAPNAATMRHTARLDQSQPID